MNILIKICIGLGLFSLLLLCLVPKFFVLFFPTLSTLIAVSLTAATLNKHISRKDRIYCGLLSVLFVPIAVVMWLGLFGVFE